MLVPARDALASVEKGIYDVRSHESRLTDVLHSATQEAERERRRLADAYRGLALVRLDALKRKEAVGELDAAERRARDLLRAHQMRLEEVQRRHGEAQSALVAAEDDHREKLRLVDAAREPITVLQEGVEEELSGDGEWRAQRARVEAAARIAEAADAKADQAEADRETKRKPYEADPLFMYLWKRGFGTAAYQAGNLARYFDRKVARLAGYDRARPNYALLNEIPLRLREHAERRAGELSAEDAKLEAIERKALEAAGILPLEASLAAALEALEAAEKRAGEVQAALAALDQERQSLIGEGGRRAEDEALSVLSQAVAREDLQSMLKQAKATPSEEDDRLVHEIERAQGAVAKADSEIARIRDEIREIARRRSELEGVRDNFRRNRYDGPGGEFELERSDVIGDMIGGIVRGAVQGALLWALLQRGYRRRGWDGGDWSASGTWSRGSRPTFRLPSSIKIGGKSRGGFRTGGRF